MASADRPAEFLSTDSDNDNHSPFFRLRLVLLARRGLVLGFLWRRIMRTDCDG